MATKPQLLHGKTGFVKEYLNDHPMANPTEVNRAWQEAGMEGSVSASLVNKLRALMGLTGNLRATSKRGKAGKGKPMRDKPAIIPTGPEPARPRRGRPPKTSTILASQARQLAEVEADLDRLLFKVMGLEGRYPRLEESLREVRRVLYRHYS